jgi:spore maturation protein CgeB
MTYKIVKITSFYNKFLNYYYARNPDIAGKSYTEQYKHIMAQGYGWSDYFQTHFSGMGIEAFEIIHNANSLQKAWAEEFGYDKSSNLIVAQLKYYKPDVVFFQDSISFNADFYNEIRKAVPSVKIMLGHCCTPFSIENIKAFSKLDTLLTCSPHFLHKFESFGLNTLLFYHAFEESLLQKINVNNNYPETDVLFIGSFIQNKEFHDARLLFIEEMLNEGIPLTIYTSLPSETRLHLYGKQMAYVGVKILKRVGLGDFMLTLPGLKKMVTLNEIPKKQHFSKKFLECVINETLYGFDMLKLLAKSKIGFNVHGGGAGDYAANARLFEVTGVGSLLLTEHMRNIHDLFVPDEEIITYKSVKECVNKAKWLSDNPVECRKIALAGQKRTLESHSIKNRVIQLNEIICGLLKNSR